MVLWQLDVESYEAVIIPHMLQEWPPQALPAMIRYESIVLSRFDDRDQTQRLPALRQALQQAGYHVVPGGADDVALRRTTAADQALAAAVPLTTQSMKNHRG